MAGKEGVGPTGRNWEVRGRKLQNWMVLEILRERKLESKKSSSLKPLPVLVPLVAWLAVLSKI